MLMVGVTHLLLFTPGTSGISNRCPCTRPLMVGVTHDLLFAPSNLWGQQSFILLPGNGDGGSDSHPIIVRTRYLCDQQ